jgi:hypothetical protein
LIAIALFFPIKAKALLDRLRNPSLPEYRRVAGTSHERTVAEDDRLLAAKDSRISRNPAGYLVAAIRHDFQDTGGTSSRVEQKPSKPKEVPSPKEEVDTEAIALAEYFEKLPIDEQARIEREATKSAGGFHRETLKRLEGKSDKLLRQFRMELIIKYLRSMQNEFKSDR